MDSKSIEKLDKHRYLSVLLLTIGLIIYMIQSTIVYINNPGYDPGNVFIAVAILGISLIIGGSIYYLVVSGMIKRSKSISSVLNNELHRTYNYRSQKLGFIVMFGASVLLMAIPFTSVSGQGAGSIIFMSGTFTILISWLIYNRR